ncbi:hypothetical protein [Streptomyces sp. TLI_171]|uniref:hypothetical protein n=1 Tax=Streptomyces sp. TLI_171 TaxID=1938859 RepID=UPI00117F7E3D|nr:hypothetical protein [Streptomyces sp. TLI_171]
MDIPDPIRTLAPVLTTGAEADRSLVAAAAAELARLGDLAAMAAERLRAGDPRGALSVATGAGPAAASAATARTATTVALAGTQLAGTRPG